MRARLLTALWILSLNVAAQKPVMQDSVSTIDPFVKKITERRLSQYIDTLSQRKWYQISYVGVPLVVEGLIVKSQNDKFRKMRNDYMPHFHRTLDNYMQYAPAAVMVGMKSVGVEGRSSWGRMLVSDAFSAAIMASVVNALKYTTRETRPDGSSNNSFPSGHTATAFMTATMLNKEYGDRYPWIGAGGYALASATGLMRMANNKHWLGDVLTGAGIGILSTELGYWLGDMIFKNKGVHRYERQDTFDPMDRPSFFGIGLAVNIPLSHYDISDDLYFRISSGSTASVEGAYFFNPYVGVGGRLSVSGSSVIVNGTDAEVNRLQMAMLGAGCYFSCPLSSRWSVGSKLLVGHIHYPELKLSEITVPRRNGVFFGSGISATFRARRRYGMRFFLDYNLLPPHSLSSSEWMNHLAIGSSFSILLSSGK